MAFRESFARKWCNFELFSYSSN